MATLHELWRAVFPQAQAVPAEGVALERPVAWVRVLKARVPAFDALEAQDLAIIQRQTLHSLNALAVEPSSVVEAVATAGGSGILLLGHAYPDSDEASAVMQQAAGLGIAGFLLEEGDASALERSAIAYIVTGQAELERRVADLESELEQAALAGVGIPGLVAIIARFLSRPVAIEGADGAVLAIHAPTGTADDKPGLGQYLQRRRGAALRVPLPAGPGDASRRRVRAAGALVLPGRGPSSELEQLAARRVAGLLALELGRGRPVSTPAGRRPERLPSDGPPWIVVVARQLDEAESTTLEQRERLRHDLQRSEPARRLALRGDASSLELRLIVAPGPDDPLGHELAQRVSRRLERPVAISRPFHDGSERAAMEAQARITLEALEALPATERAQLSGGNGSVVGRTDLAPAYRLLAGVQALPNGVRHAHALLAPVLSGRRQRDGLVLDTLRAVLEHPGLAEAAAVLGIHRNTLAYRLQRIEQRTGWQLSDAGLRFSLALAVRLVQSAQEDEEDSPNPTRRGRTQTV
jgi:hypothetical protein